MVRNLRRSLCALLALALMLAAPAALADWVGAYVGSATKVYQYPSTSSAGITVSAGTPVVVTGIKDGWAQVRSSYGITAYCPINMLVLAQRVKAYVVSTTPIYQYATTSSYAAGPLSVNTEVYIIGCDSGFYRVQNANGSITGYVPTGCIGPNAIAVKPAIDPRQFVQIYDWYKGGSDLLQKGETGMIYDIWSGQFFNVHRMGGSSHADLEPLTLNDTRILYSIVGGEYSWESRPVILITSRGFAAAAINTMPHGEQTITTNGFEGQFCLHMINSRTHGSDSINNEHQKAIREAYNWAH